MLFAVSQASATRHDDLQFAIQSLLLQDTSAEASSSADFSLEDLVSFEVDLLQFAAVQCSCCTLTSSLRPMYETAVVGSV